MKMYVLQSVTPQEHAYFTVMLLQYLHCWYILVFEAPNFLSVLCYICRCKKFYVKDSVTVMLLENRLGLNSSTGE